MMLNFEIDLNLKDQQIFCAEVYKRDETNRKPPVKIKPMAPSVVGE